MTITILNQPLALLWALALQLGPPDGPASDPSEPNPAGPPPATIVPPSPADSASSERAAEEPPPPEQPPAAPPLAAAEVEPVLAPSAHWNVYVAVEVGKVQDQRGAFCDNERWQADGHVAAKAKSGAAPARRRAYYQNNSAVGANPFSGATNLSTGTERIAAAVNIDVKGVEAGVILSPLAFRRTASRERPPQWTLLLASIKDGKTRVGTGVGLTLTRDPDIQKIIRTSACKDGWEEDVEKGVLKVLTRDVRTSYFAVCNEVVPEFKPAAGDPAFAPLQEACSSRPDRIYGLVTIVDVLSRKAEKLQEKGKKLTKEEDAFVKAVAAHLSDFAKLEAAENSLTDLAAGLDDDALKQGYLVEVWKAPVVRFGVDGSLDLDIIKLGYKKLEPAEAGEEPEREKLPNGELIAGRAGPSLLVKKERLEVTLGVNFGAAQVVGDTTKIGGFVQPNVAIAYVVGFLDRRQRTDGDYGKRVPKFTDKGDLPARVVLGVRAAIEFPFAPPAFQEGSLNSATILVHSDFVVTEKLKFRIGVPISAALVEGEQDDDGKKTGAQWSIPVFGATVLAF